MTSSIPATPVSPTTITSQPKLPVTQLVILSICRFAEPVALTGVFPYLPEMIESFGVERNEVARWVGITSAVFSVSQCLTAIPWVRASDKYGRKPIILLAMTCAMGSSLFFGFSRSLHWAIAARVLSGASNGNVGILRTTVAEMVPHKALQPRAFSVLPLIWQVGSIVGPMLGGALASPATKLPQFFGNSAFLKEFPFALPNLVSGVVFTIGILVGFLFLKESLESRKYQRDYGRIIGRYLTRSCTRQRKYQRLNTEDYDDDEYDNHDDEDDPESPLSSKRPRHKFRKPDPPARYRDVFTPQSNLNLLAYIFLAMHSIAYDQILPVMLHLPINHNPNHHKQSLPFHFTGGFGLDSSRIGVIFMIFGIFSMIMQFTLFPYVTQRLGALVCLRACTFVFPIVCFVTPYTVLMPTPMGQQAALLGVTLVKALANVFAFPCVTILMTNSAASLSVLGTLNGVAVSLSAIGRAIGPYFAGRTFTWGISAGYGIAAWWLLGIFAIAGHVVTWWIQEMEGFASNDEQEQNAKKDAAASTEVEGEAVQENIQLETRGVVVRLTGADVPLSARREREVTAAELQELLDDSDEETMDVDAPLPYVAKT